MSLFGDEAPRKKARKAPAAKATGDPAVARMFARYHAGFLRRWNACAEHGRLGCRQCVAAWAPADPENLVKPVINGGHAGKQFKDYLVWGEELLGEVIDYFFTTADPQVTRGDYKLTGSSGAFFTHAQRLMLDLKRQRARLDERTAANMDAAQRATRSRLT